MTRLGLMGAVLVLMLALAAGAARAQTATVAGNLRVQQIAVEERVGGLRVGIIGEAGRTYWASAVNDAVTTTTPEVTATGGPQWFTLGKLGLQARETTVTLSMRNEDGTTFAGGVKIKNADGSERQPKTRDVLALAVGAGEGDYLAAEITAAVNAMPALSAAQKTAVMIQVRRGVRTWQTEAVARARAARAAAEAAQDAQEDAAGALD